MYGGGVLGMVAGGFVVLSSAKMGTRSWRYYTDDVACRTTEYYLGLEEAPGRWDRRGLAQLGLGPGAVMTEQQLEALLARGLHPGSGARLGPGVADRWGDRLGRTFASRSAP